MADDSELLRLYVASRSETAFAELVTRYLSLVYHAALRQLGGNAHLAEDVTQIVFSRLAQKAASLHGHSTLAGWLHTTTRFVARETMRAAQRRRAREQEAQLMNESCFEPQVDWEQLRPVIDEALGELNDSDREALLQRFFAGRPLAEIGSALRVSENTARMRIERALGKLQPLLAKRGVTSTGTALSLTLAHQTMATVPAGLAATISSASFVTAGNVAAAGFLGFMSTTKFTSALAIAALLTSSVAVYEVRTARASEAALAVERRGNLALAARADDASRRAKSAQQSLAQARAAAANANSATSVAPSSSVVENEGNGPMGPRPPGSRARGRALAAAYPEVHQLWVRLARSEIAERFKDLYRELNLSAAEIEPFEMIMISGVSWGTSIPLTKPEERYLPGKTPLLSITMDAAPVLPEAEKDARLRQLLGESGFSRLKAFQDQPRDSRINQLASALYYTDTPLTPELGAKFEQILIDRSRSHRGASSAEYWSAVQNDARAFLSAPQLDALQGLQAQDEFNSAAPGNRSSKRIAEKASGQ